VGVAIQGAAQSESHAIALGPGGLNRQELNPCRYGGMGLEQAHAKNNAESFELNAAL
jgi:hypothetical protein